MKLQQVLSLVRQAIDDYSMIEENDCIAVGISGGKDSLTLLYAMANLRHFYPIPFTLKAVTIDVGFDNMNFEKVIALCKELNVEYHIEKTQIKEIVFDVRNESNPCSLCSKLRKGALNEVLKKIGCNKVAYAHHKDDVVETMLLSMLYEGRFHTFSPVTYLGKADISIIRPMIYMNESDVKGFINKYDVPVIKSSCPVDGHTKREYAHNLLMNINRENKGAKNRMFTAIKESGIPGWNNDIASY